MIRIEAVYQNVEVNSANADQKKVKEKDFEEMKYFWKNEVLNESVLYAGNTIGGLVYLPFSRTAEIFKIIIPVCVIPESHLFRQVQINE